MLSWLERHQLLVLGAAALVLAATLAVGELRADGPPPAIEFRYGPGLSEGTPIRVHIAGAVARPGVYELREGDRVADAIEAAGGPTDEADADEVNLARRVHDEEQLTVPRRPGASAVIALLPGQKLDVNTATAKQFETLPGIGEAYARRIVDSRAVDGPYTTTQELVDRKVIPRATYDKVRDLITVSP